MPSRSCPACKRVTSFGVAFCPDCGKRIPDAPPNPVEVHGTAEGEQAAGRGRRLVAYMIDAFIASFIGVWQIPIIGEFLGLVALLYMLCRDMNGASLGKLALGMRVRHADGGPSSLMQRILRNVPFAFPLLPLLLPFEGMDILATGVVSTAVILVEGIALLFTGSRLSDRLASTAVFRCGDRRQFALAAGRS